MGLCELLCPGEQVLQNRPYNQRIELPSTFDEEGRSTPHAPRTHTHTPPSEPTSSWVPQL
jgi:hypothetical protein